jgi:Cysteine sulfinate desulfinase/cysteine desulfurase and related enzymes
VLSWASPLKAQGWTIEYLKAKGGFVDIEDFEARLDKSVRLVAVQNVNNVTGAIEPVKELVAITRRKEKEFGRPVFFFSDSVQALGKVPFDLRALDVDGASFSAHKIKGPRGIGALYLKKPINVLSKAGGQENGMRGGTENLPAIAGFVKALELYLKEDREKTVKLNSVLRTYFKEKGIAVLSPVNASPYVLSIATPLPSEVMTRMLSDEGYCISAGSACSNNAAGKAESVIRAMGFDSKTAGGTLRLSFSPKSSKDEAMALANLIYLKAKDF